MIKWRRQLLTSIQQPNTSSSAKYAKLLHEKEKKKKAAMMDQVSSREMARVAAYDTSNHEKLRRWS